MRQNWQLLPHYRSRLCRRLRPLNLKLQSLETGYPCKTPFDIAVRSLFSLPRSPSWSARARPRPNRAAPAAASAMTKNRCPVRDRLNPSGRPGEASPRRTSRDDPPHDEAAAGGGGGGGGILAGGGGAFPWGRPRSP